MSANWKNVSDKTIRKAHCDWVIKQTKEIKALLNYDDKTVRMNKTRAKFAIETAMQSLRELEAYINEI